MSDTEMPAESPSGGDLNAAHMIGNPEDAEALFSGVVFVSDKEKNLLLTSKGMCLQASSKSKNKSKSEDLLLPWCDIIWANTESAESEESEQPESTFNVHYIHRQNDKRLQHKCMTVTVEEGDVNRWVSLFQEECLKVPGRPKKLYVVVNPVGGGGKGRQIYEKFVAPLFKMAQIECTVKVTEKAKHGVELAETEDFTGYDGIVSCGGDGMYQEILLGLTLQMQKKANVEYNNPEATLVRPTIPVGLIPTGTGNRVCIWANDGVADVATAALHIIRGEQHYGMVYSVHNGNKFVSIGGLTFAYGFFTDMCLKCEGLRWLGKARFFFGMLSMLLRKRRMFKPMLEYQQRKQPSEEKSEGGSGDTKDESAAGGIDWIIYDNNGKQYCGILINATEFVDAGDRYILNHFGKGSILFLDSGGGITGFFKQMMMMGTGKKLPSPIPNIDTVEHVTRLRFKVETVENETAENVTETRAKARHLEHLVTLDGEVITIDTPQVDIRLIPNFAPVYGCLPS